MKNFIATAGLAFISLLFFSITGCLPPVTPAETYTLGGNINGLNGSLEITDGSSPLVLEFDGPFAFTTIYSLNSPYDMTIVSHPNNQVCTIEPASGVFSLAADIVDIAITCTTNTIPPFCPQSCEVEDAQCDDGQNNTVWDSCKNSACQGVDFCEGVVCGSNGSNIQFCQPDTGLCVDAPTCSTPGENCDDNNPASYYDQCNSNGLCVGISNLCQGVSCGNDSACNPETGACVSCQL